MATALAHAAEPQAGSTRLDDDVAELVVIFPSNVWGYDGLDYFPFSTLEAKAVAAETRRAKEQSRCCNGQACHGE